jgi:hypothetical protein
MKNRITLRRARRKRRTRKHTMMHYKRFSKRNNSIYKMNGGVGRGLGLREGFNKIMHIFRGRGQQPPEDIPEGILKDIPLLHGFTQEELYIINSAMEAAEDILEDKNIDKYTNEKMYNSFIDELQTQFHEAIKTWRETRLPLIFLRVATGQIIDNLDRYLKIPENQKMPIETRAILVDVASEIQSPVPEYVAAIAAQTPGYGIDVPVKNSFDDLKLRFGAIIH